MDIIRSPRTKNFSLIGNEIIRNRRVTHMTRAVLIEILSYPDGWSTTADKLWQEATQYRSSRSRGEGRRAYRAVFAEMEEFGYLVRERRRLPNGRFETVLIVHDEPVKPAVAVAPEAPQPDGAEVPPAVPRSELEECDVSAGGDRHTANGRSVTGTSTTSTLEAQHSKTGSSNKVYRPASRRGRTAKRSAAASTVDQAIEVVRTAAAKNLPHDQRAVEELTDSQALGLWFKHIHPRRHEIRNEVRYLGSIFASSERLRDFLANCEPVCPACITPENSCTCYDGRLDVGQEEAAA